MTGTDLQTFRCYRCGQESTALPTIAVCYVVRFALRERCQGAPGDGSFNQTTHFPRQAILCPTFPLNHAYCGSDLLAQMGKLVDDAERIKQRAEERLDLRTALQAVRELCRVVELAAKLRGEIASGTKTQTSVPVDIGSEWGPCPWTIEQIDGIVAGSSELQRFRALTIGTDLCAESPFDPQDFEWLWTSIEQRLATKNRLLSDGSQPAASDDLNAEEGKFGNPKD